MNSIVKNVTFLFVYNVFLPQSIRFKFFERKSKALRADLEELGKLIYPYYQEIASSFLVQRVNLKRNSEKLISAINDRGEDWRREIDIIKKLKSGTEITESEHMDFLQKQEDEINRSISEMSQTIGELKKLKDSNDVSLLCKYKSRNAEFREMPPKFVVTLPSFSFPKTDTKQLTQLTGFLAQSDVPIRGKKSFLIKRTVLCFFKKNLTCVDC